MLRSLERDLFLNANETNKRKIIEVFRLAKTIQLPVIEDDEVTGILDLFTFLNVSERQLNVNIRNIMDTQIVIAGISNHVFLFSDSKQFILPFVNEDGKYVGFVNRIMQKCYLPSQEYIQVMRESTQSIDYGNIDKLKHTYDFILESNYDGIYVTTNKGKTLSINNNCEYINNVSANDIDSDNLIISVEENRSDTVRVIQKIQERNEVSVSDDVLTDGGIVRVVNNFHTIRKELQEAQELIDKYENEIQFLRLEKSKTKDIVADSYEMKRIVNFATRIANVDSTVLIQGESGVGKGVISKLIHNNSQRKDKPFIKIDCSSIPEQLIESELFGYEQGAFTGAQKGGKTGMIEMANEGTLFLDEIGELPLNMQTKLLCVLQDKEIRRIGSSVTIPVNVRIIAATNRDLAKMVKEGQFRNDLYYRIDVVPIKIPPLCERKEDIKPLIENCLNRFNNEYGLNKKIESKAMKALIQYNWPGNVRELENVIEFLVVSSDSDVIPASIIPSRIRKNEGEKRVSLEDVSSMKDAVRLVEIDLLLKAMKKAKSTDEMAKMLKLDRTTVSRKMQKYNIKTNFYQNK